MKYEYLDGRTLNPSEALEATSRFKLDELNSLYNGLIAEYGLKDFTFTTTMSIPNTKPQRYTAPRKCSLASMDMHFNGTLSCRGYNRFCALWGEGKPNAVEEGGHQFNEDLIVATEAFGGKVYHWDRHSSIWNVKYGLMTGVYSNLDVHTEVVNEIASIQQVKLDNVKQYRTVSKILTFRVFFGEGIYNAKRHFFNALERNEIKEMDTLRDFITVCKIGSFEELIELFYEAVETLGYFKDFERYDEEKDVTVFLAETAIYIYAAEYLWRCYGIKTILKYDSFYCDKPVTDKLMEEAITYGMNRYIDAGLPTGHKIPKLDTYLANLAATEAKRNKLDSHKAVSDWATKSEWEDINGYSPVKASKVCKLAEIAYSKADAAKTGAALGGKIGGKIGGKVTGSGIRAEQQLNEVLDRMKIVAEKLANHTKLSNSEMAAKSAFKKKHPDLYNEIFNK